MTKKVRAVVIGGGVVGASTLYHLANKGWDNVVLLERKMLTSGSTWHAAGLLPLFNMSYSVGQIHKYSVNFYQKLQEETGMNVGFKQVSNIRLASNQDRMDEYLQYKGVADTIGVNVEVLKPEQVKEIWPLCSTDGLIGAIRHPDDGYIQPADLTQALATGARKKGAQILINTEVLKIQNKDNLWYVETNNGDFECEHIISCTGNFARETGKMVGLDIPVIPVEHQFIVMDQHPKIIERQKNNLPEMGVLRDSDSSWYMREEAGGLLLGPYENGAPVCYVDGPDKDSEFELFQENLDRISEHIESAIKRVPIFGEMGLKKAYNGAIAYTPDGSPIIGPAWGLKNFWINEGHSFGITAAGGAGWQLAEWIVNGEPTIDMLGVDPRRFGSYATQKYLIEKNEEAYANVFTIHYPDEERPAGRPLKTSPCYDKLKKMGAVFGASFGWERANWFAPPGVKPVDDWSFRRSKYHKHVGNEVKNLAKNVGVLDLSGFAKCRISGKNAERFLNKLVANKLPSKIGRISLCHSLTSKGGVHSEFTITRESEDSFYIVSAGSYTRLDHDWILKHMNGDKVKFEDLTNSLGVLVLAGPKSRELIERCSLSKFDNNNFPWLSAQNINIGLAPVFAMRVNFVGELGWELHHPIEYQNQIFDILFSKGEDLNIKPFGIRAMDSLRIEKSYRLPGRELSIEYSAIESGLNRFVAEDKDEFLGKAGLVDWKSNGFLNSFVTLEIKGVEDADALGNNPIYSNNKLIGRATSGGFGHRLNKSIALAMVNPNFNVVGQKLEINILGKNYECVVISESPYDPENKKIRS